MDHLYRDISECESKMGRIVFTLKVLEQARDTIRNDVEPLRTLWGALTLSKGLRRADELIGIEIESERRRLKEIKEHVECVKKWIAEREERLKLLKE